MAEYQFSKWDYSVCSAICLLQLMTDCSKHILTSLYFLYLTSHIDVQPSELYNECFCGFAPSCVHILAFLSSDQSPTLVYPQIIFRLINPTSRNSYIILLPDPRLWQRVCWLKQPSVTLRDKRDVSCHLAGNGGLTTLLRSVTMKII